MYVQPSQSVLHKPLFRMTLAVGILFVIARYVLTCIVLQTNSNNIDIDYQALVISAQILNVLPLFTLIALIVILKRHRSAILNQILNQAPVVPQRIVPNQNLVFTDQRPEVNRQNFSNENLRAHLAQGDQINNVIFAEDNRRPGQLNQTIYSIN